MGSFNAFTGGNSVAVTLGTPAQRITLSRSKLSKQYLDHQNFHKRLECSVTSPRKEENYKESQDTLLETRTSEDLKRAPIKRIFWYS